MRYKTYNGNSAMRILATKALPGERWLSLLTEAGFRVDVVEGELVPSHEDLMGLIGDTCYAVIGQLSEVWDRELVTALGAAGCKVITNYAVGYNNIDVEAAQESDIAVCNTPGVLTRTTAEMGVALTFAAARRVVEGDRFMRDGHFKGWLPKLYRGELLWGKKLGLIGAGRIGSAYAEMMVMGHAMSCIYLSPSAKPEFEERLNGYYEYRNMSNRVERADNLDSLLSQSDVIALFPTLNPSTHHLINSKNLPKCKTNAILLNMSRGPCVHEAALVTHLKKHPRFYAALDVFEREPALEEGLNALPNAVLTPHTGSASYEARNHMATLCALNILGVHKGLPPWGSDDMTPFLTESPPEYTPSRVS